MSTEGWICFRVFVCSKSETVGQMAKWTFEVPSICVFEAAGAADALARGPGHGLGQRRPWAAAALVFFQSVVPLIF